MELSPRHRKLYDTLLQRERQKVLGLIEDLDRNRFIVFRSLTLLRMLSLDASPGRRRVRHPCRQPSSTRCSSSSTISWPRATGRSSSASSPRS